VLAVAIQRFLVELNRHGHDCLLEMRSVCVQKPFVFYVGKVTESGRDVRLELDLDALDLALVNPFLLQVVRLRKFHVLLCLLDKEELGSRSCT